MSIHNGNKAKSSPSLIPEVVQPDAESAPSPQVSHRATRHSFDQQLLLQQSPIWSHTILWALIGVVTLTGVWASVAKVEQAVSASGKLEPVGAVKDIQSPVGGVVKAIYVSDGIRVKQGSLLLSLDTTSAQAKLSSLQKIRTNLIQENQFYQTTMTGRLNETDILSSRLPQLPPELITLTKSRTALVAENKLYRAQLDGDMTPSTDLNLSQKERLQSNQAELNSRIISAQLEGEQVNRQLMQTKIRLASARNTLAINYQILNKIAPIAKIGAVSQMQHLQQQQSVETGTSEVNQLIQEQERLYLAISSGKEKMQNILDQSRKDLLTLMADNTKRLAEIDSQLTKAILENNKRLAEIDSELSETELTLKYQDVRAPVSGTVFDLKAHSAGFVTNASESILKIVPDDALTANVFITNRDIGFVKVGMDVDIHIDSFSFSEFGGIKGKLISIGSDALPPDQIHNYYRFPAKVRLERQSLVINGQEVSLQSGMSVNTNIKVRSRTVMSIFTDLFTNSVESLKVVR